MASEKVSWRLEVGNEWVAADPFGKVKPKDVSQVAWATGGADGVRLRAARNGYASFRLCVIGKGEYRLTAEMRGVVAVDLFRCWYHKLSARRVKAGSPKYCSDALVPFASGSSARLPDPDNAVKGQTHQEYWVDLFVPRDAPVGRASGLIVLEAGGARYELPVGLDVLEYVVPDEDVVTCDHNSYGCRWIPEMFPDSMGTVRGEADYWKKVTGILFNYYRLTYEHRGLLSNLGAGHAGTFDRIYGPRTVGRGRGKSLTDWKWFDHYHGPLLDGSVFAEPAAGTSAARRPARPIWGVYTPINANWPADYLYWGQPGYEVEFARCVGEFDRHFREKGWTSSHPYFFFNHKKRFRWFEWDGDEPKFTKDDPYWAEMGRLFKEAVGDTPVPWLYRADASWQMKNHFERFAGVVNYWVCNSFARWYPQEVRQVVERGDVVWTYSGTPGVSQASSALLEFVWKIWGRGVHGHCEWLCVRPGADPWFDCDGAETGMIYPGDRFGIAGPIPSARLKIQRNAVQDLNVIDARAKAAGRLEQVRSHLADRVGVTLWETPPPAVHKLPPEEWNGHNLSGQPDENMTKHAELDALWWTSIRSAALDEEVK